MGSGQRFNTKSRPTQTKGADGSATRRSLSFEPIVLREPLGRLAAGFGAVADPVVELGLHDRERATGQVPSES